MSERINFASSALLRKYFLDGGWEELAQQRSFELDVRAFQMAWDELAQQHPELGLEERAARAAYRLLAKPRPGGRDGVEVPRPPQWARNDSFVWRALKIAWAIAVLLLLAALALRAEPEAPSSYLSEAARVRAIRLYSPLAQFDAPIIRLKNQGTSLAIIPAGIVNFNCSTNMSCTWNSGTRQFDMTASTTAGSAWSSLTAPTVNLSMPHGAFTTIFTYGAATGAGVDLFNIVDTTGNTGTGHLFAVNTVGTSAAKAVRFTAGGTANGVEVDTTGLLLAIGTGGIRATDIAAGGINALADFAGALCGTNQILEDQGASWACINTPTGGGAHALLSATHTDTTAGTVVRGDVVVGQGATPTWQRLALGAAGRYLRSDGTDLLYSVIPVGDLPAHNLLSAQHGDTTAASVARGDLVVGIGVTPTWQRLAHPANANRFLRSNANEPGWAQVDLATADITGILGLANGGTNQSAWTASRCVQVNSGGTALESAAAACGSGGTHNLLSATHTDTTAGTVVRGDLVTGQGATPAWQRLAKGTASQCLQMDGSAVDIVWGSCASGSIGGSGTANTVAKFTAATTIGNSCITDDGTTVDLGGGACTGAKVPRGAGAAPTADGDVRYDTTQDALKAGGAGAVTGAIPRLVKMTNCTTEGNCTTTNEVDADAGQQGTTETTFASNWSMPANFLTTNKAIRVCAIFEMTSVASPPTIMIRLKLGSANVVAQNSAYAPAGAGQTDGGYPHCYVIQGTAAPGASVSIEAGYDGHLAFNIGAARNGVNQPVTGIATNGALTVQVSAQWGTATTGNTIQLHQFMVMEMN